MRSAIGRRNPLYGSLRYHTPHSNVPTENPFSVLKLFTAWLRASLLAENTHLCLLPRSINPRKSSQYQNPKAFLFFRRLAASPPVFEAYYF